MSISNTGSVDLESVLNVGRRTLSSIGESTAPRHQPQYTDTIYLKREDNSNSILSINSQILIFGELQLLNSIFERYTSNITIYEESFIDTNPTSPLSSTKPSFSATAETHENEEDSPPMVSTLRQTSISSSKGSISPPNVPGSPIRKKTLSSVGRSQTTSSISSEYSSYNLEGKRYGCIKLPNMSLIEILEILLRTGLDLVYVFSDYDKDNVLHQNFVFSKTRPASQKYGQLYARSVSFVGT